MKPRWLSVVLAVLAASCGGGGGAPPPGPAANLPPVFSSGASASVREHSTAPFYSAQATDPEGGTITYSIVGGADAAKFALVGGNAIAFAAAADFESPADANRDNVYGVQLGASDGQLQAVLTLLVTVVDVPELAAPIDFPGRVVDLANVPGTPATMFVGKEDGKIFRIDPLLPNDKPVYLDLNFPTWPTGSPTIRGLRAIAPAPDYSSSGLLYVSVATTNDIEVRRYRRAASGGGDLASGEVILRVAAPNPAGCPAGGCLDPELPLGGGLAFGPDGHLYVGIGTQAQSATLNDLGGKVLRIDVARDGFPADPLRNYAIPQDNPYSGGGAAPEVFASGAINPISLVFDADRLFVADSSPPRGSCCSCCEQRLYLLRVPQDGRAVLARSGGTIAPVLTRPSGWIALGGAYRGPISSYDNRFFIASTEGLTIGNLEGRILSIPIDSLVPGVTLNIIDFREDFRNRSTIRDVLITPNGRIFFATTGRQVLELHL